MEKNSDDERLPYRIREPFLSTTELALFRVLTEMMGTRYIICTKVSLNDVFYIVRPNENVHFFNKFFRKHVDFLLCDPRTMNPAFGVEMVKGASKSEVRKSDEFIEELFVSAGLPLVHIPTSDRYEISELVPLFQIAVTKISGTTAMRSSSHASDSVPMCPICGKMMVLRVYRDGKNMGKKYYGCMDSPRCRGFIPID